MSRTITVDVDIYIDEVIKEFADLELIDEINDRGYEVIEYDDGMESLDSQDWDKILFLIDQQPPGWEISRLRDKVMRIRFGK